MPGGQWRLESGGGGALVSEAGMVGRLVPVVALSDGAKTIRVDLAALFGQGVRIVLDWYPLEERVYE